MTPHDVPALRTLLEQQAGVVARRQVLEHATQVDLRRWVRRRELVRVHEGVYVDHTGELSTASRQWAAVQRYWPAALALGSAMGMESSVVHVAVASDRSFGSVVPGVRVHRLKEFDRRVQLTKSPPVQRYDDAVVSQLDRATSRTAALDLVSGAVRSRRTTAERLAEEVARRKSIADRAWLLDVLRDAAAGVHSVLESTYLDKVERAHGLPVGERQRRAAPDGQVVYRDVLYESFRLVVELDGRLGHETNEDRWDDMDRDLDAALDELLTVRLGWRQSETEPCRTAVRLGTLLGRRGWAGRPHGCRADCQVS